MDFDYNLTPGRFLDQKDKLKVEHKPTISIITPFYSGHEFIKQTANSVLNQTYPYYEWIIISDGKKDSETKKLLTSVEQMDKRIKVYYKDNEGLAATRDYGASKSSDCTDYLFFLDDDDLIEKTYLECAYWTLETNNNAAFAYTDCVGFGTSNYLWAKWFTLKEEKKENMLVATAMIRKKDFLEVGGYGTREKGINEDWIFWMKMFSKRKIPVRMNYYGFWYRRKETGELNKSRNKANKNKTRLLLDEQIKNIKSNIEAIQYPHPNYDWNEVFKANIDNLVLPYYQNNKKIKILMIIPWMTMGGADKFNLDLISRIDKKKYEIIVIATEPNVNTWRQKMEQEASVIYDLTTFLDKKYWHLFINYIIESKNIDIIFNTNSLYGYESLPYIKNKYPNIPVIDYIHMEEWYNRNGGYSRDSSAVSSVIDRTLTCNKKSAQILVDYFKCEQQKIGTVYIGVDEEKFNPDNYDVSELKQKYNIPKDKFVINYLCRIDFQKRPFLFLEIIKSLYDRNKDFVCLVAGDGPLLEQLKRKCSSYGLNEKVVFLGAVNNSHEIYMVSDLSLNCSIKEGLALTTYESLAMGIPVVSSDVGGQSELINSKVGIVVPCMQKEEEIKNFNYSEKEINNYVDAICKIMDNVDKYKSCARKRILDGFTINQMVSNMENEFSNILKKKTTKTCNLNQDICLELINQHILAYEKIYSYLCEDSKVMLFGSTNYRKGQTTSKFKLSLIRFIKKLHLEKETKLTLDIFKDIGRLFKSFANKIFK